MKNIGLTVNGYLTTLAHDVPKNSWTLRTNTLQLFEIDSKLLREGKKGRERSWKRHKFTPQQEYLCAWHEVRISRNTRYHLGQYNTVWKDISLQQHRYSSNIREVNTHTHTHTHTHRSKLRLLCCAKIRTSADSSESDWFAEGNKQQVY